MGPRTISLGACRRGQSAPHRDFNLVHVNWDAKSESALKAVCIRIKCCTYRN
jgi:hypothetical protein